MSGNQKARRKYTDEDILRATKLFSELPQKDKQKTALSGTQFIQSIAKEIRSLQTKGYTLQEIVELLASNDLPIGLPTVKSVLSRMTGKRGKRDSKKPSRSKSNNDNTSEPRIDS